jgi:ABC-type lipoprotein export system ATPase subunit
MNPDLVLADEPTGNLDTKAANGVFELMRDVNRLSGASFLLVTHNMVLARRCDRIIELIDGLAKALARKRPKGGKPSLRAIAANQRPRARHYG